MSALVWQLLGAALGGIGAASRQRKQNKEAQRAYDQTRRDTVADYYRQRADAQADFWMQHRASKNMLDYQLGANRTDAQLREENRYEWLVEGAQRAGFNPLTALGATGAQLSGGGQASMAALSPVTLATTPAPVLGAGPTTLETLGSAIAQLEDPIDKEARRLRNELTFQQIQTEKNNRARLGQLPVMRRTASPIEASYDPGPAGWRGSWGEGPAAPWYLQPTVHVAIPFGKNRSPRWGKMPASVAERFGIKAGDLLTGGDLSEIFGEWGEAAGLPNIQEMANAFLSTPNIYEDAYGATDNTANEPGPGDPWAPVPPDGRAPDGSPDTPAKQIYRWIEGVTGQWRNAPLFLHRGLG